MSFSSRPKEVIPVVFAIGPDMTCIDIEFHPQKLKQNWPGIVPYCDKHRLIMQIQPESVFVFSHLNRFLF